MKRRETKGGRNGKREADIEGMREGERRKEVDREGVREI